MSDVNAYLSKIKKRLFILLLFPIIFTVIRDLTNNLHDLGFEDAPVDFECYLPVLSLGEKASTYDLIFSVIFIATFIFLYMEKIFGVFLFFCCILFECAKRLEMGKLYIETPIEGFIGGIWDTIIYGIIFVVWLKILLNQNFDLSTGKTKIGSSGLIFEDAYRLAERGNTEAQIDIGNLYFKGLGVQQDFSQAHMWFNLAAGSGNNVAAKKRDLVAKKMSAQQISDAQELAKGFIAKQS